MLPTQLRTFTWARDGSDRFRVVQIVGAAERPRRVTLLVADGTTNLPAIALARDIESLRPNAAGTALASPDNCDIIDSQGNPFFDTPGPTGRASRILDLRGDDRVYATSIAAAYNSAVRLAVWIQDGVYDWLMGAA
jgi:hypothetical protein